MTAIEAMPKKPVSTSPVKVRVALATQLESEAFAALIKHEAGFVATTEVGSTDDATVVLSRHCGANGGPPHVPTLVVAPDETLQGCHCCQWISPDATASELVAAVARAAGADAPTAAGKSELLNKLTRRERQVLQLVGLGKSVTECAEALGVTNSTIGNHKYRLMRKLGVSTSLQLLRVAVRNGVADIS